MTFKFSLDLEAGDGDGVLSALAAYAALILKGITTMTSQAETILADLAAAKASSDAANAKSTELIALANSIKSKLDAALASGAPMTATELQAIRDAISEIAVSDDSAKAATDAAIVADAPAAPVVPAAPVA